MEKIKVCLMNTPTEYVRVRMNISPPLGLCYLAATLNKSKYEVTGRLYANHVWTKAEKLIRKDLQSIKPDIIGLQCFTYNRTSCFKTIKIAKEILPNVKIIIGGGHATAFPNKIMEKYNGVDFVVIGEAEETFPELLDNLDHPEKVKGIYYKDKQGIKSTEPREVLHILDSLPFPQLDLFDKEQRTSKTIRLETARGCPYQCNFCSATMFWKFKVRCMSPKRAVDEIESLSEKYPGFEIYLADSCFTADISRAEAICKEMIKRDLKIRWTCETRVDRVNADILRLMKKAGCIKISYGIESGSPKIITTIGKKVTNQQVINAFKMTHEAGIEIILLLMVGQPGETQETIDETKALVKELNKYTNLKEVAPLMVFPDTRLYADMKAKGQITDDWWFENEGIPYYTVEHSYEKLREWASEIVFYSHIIKGKRHLIGYVFKQFIKSPFNFIKLFFRRKYYMFLFKRVKK